MLHFPTLFVGTHTVAMESTVTFMLLLSINGLISSSFGVDYFVKPTPHTNCSEPCHTFSHYISNSEYYFVSNVTFHFLPGTFTLESNQPLSIGKVAGFSLIGGEQYTIGNLTNDGHQYLIPVSEIECVGRTGIVIFDSSNVTIKSLRIRNCRVGIGFSCIVDTSVFHVLIENSTVAGIFGYQMFGNNSVVDSTFVRSTVNFEYQSVPCQVSQAKGMSTSRVEIERSYFFYGYQDPQYADAGGLAITIKGYPVDILLQVTESVFSKTMAGEVATWECMCSKHQRS